MTTGIYRITSPSGKVYIGQSIEIEKRFSRYRNLKCDGQRHLYSSLVKYGVGSHIFEIVYELPKDVSRHVLDQYEIFYLSALKEANIKLLNLTDGGKRGKLSDESKLRLSTAIKGHKVSEETKQKIANKLIGRVYGKRKPHSEEAKLRISVAKKGKKFSEEARSRMKYKKSESHRISMYTAKMDKSIYTFKNTSTGEEFTGRRHDFYNKYPVQASSVTRLVSGEYKITKNWVLVI